MGNFPLSLGPLDDPEYIEDITADFREEQHREPYGADELTGGASTSTLPASRRTPKLGPTSECARH
jgi:hypothetical protein